MPAAVHAQLLPGDEPAGLVVGQERDRPGDVLGQQRGQHPGDVERVVEPGPLRPGRVVDALLDDLVLEGGVGEGVEGDDLDAVRVDRLAQPGDGVEVGREPACSGGGPIPERTSVDRLPSTGSPVAPPRTAR